MVIFYSEYVLLVAFYTCILQIPILVFVILVTLPLEW